MHETAFSVNGNHEDPLHELENKKIMKVKKPRYTVFQITYDEDKDKLHLHKEEQAYLKEIMEN